MKRPIILAALLGVAAGASAALPAASGPEVFLSRAGLMAYDDHNFIGAIDQLDFLSDIPAPAEVEGDALLLRAIAELRTGHPATAYTLLGQWLDANPASPRRTLAAYLRFESLWAQGKWEDALMASAYIDPMALTVSRQEALNFRMGYAYMLTGDDAMAEGCFRMLLGSPGWRDTARFYMSYIAYRRKDYARALEGFKAIPVSDKAPANAAPYYTAQIEFSLGNYEASLAAARRLLDAGGVGEFRPECNRVAGESLFNLGRTSEAAPYLWKYCAEVKEPAPSAYYILGVDEYAKGHTDDAVKLLQQATATETAMAQSAWLYLGQAYRTRGDLSSAMMAFERAYRMDVDPAVSEEAFYNYAVARMDGGRIPFGNSVGLLEEFVRRYPDSRYATEVQHYIVDGYMTANDYAGALAAIGRIRRPDAAMTAAKQRALFVLGSRAYAAGKVGDAIRQLGEARALATDPSVTAQCDLWLGDCLYTRGDYAGAAADYRKYLATNPTDLRSVALARYGLAYSLFSTQEYAQAATSFAAAESAVKRAGGETEETLLPDITARMADCRYYEGRYAEAKDLYRTAAELNPSAADYATFQMGMMEGLMKNYKGKVETLERMIAAFPTSGLVPQALLEEAESLTALGDTKGAISTYNRLVKGYPTSAPGRNGYLQLAITYINTGDRNKGIDTYKKVIRQYPSSEEARIAADDLRQIYAADGRLPELVKFLEGIDGAPRFEASELEQTAFTAAENAYIGSGSTTALESYLQTYPKGAHEPQALFYMAEAHSADNPRKAAEYAKRLLDIYPDAEVAEDVLLIKAQAESDLGKTEAAYESFTILEAKSAGANMLRDARLGIMRTAFDLAKYREAARAADRLLGSTAAVEASSADEIRFVRAMSNSRLGNRAEALADWEILEKDLRSVYGAKSAVYHAQALLEAGRRKEAREVADRLIGSDTPQTYWLARGFIVYSDILRADGSKFEADEYLKSLRSNYPGQEADIFEMIDTRLGN